MWPGTIRQASAGDAGDVAELAAELAMSFEFSPQRFRANYPALLALNDACLVLAVDRREIVGYLLGFCHLTFYANGPVGWVEEIVVRPQSRGAGAGRSTTPLATRNPPATSESCSPVLPRLPRPAPAPRGRPRYRGA
jgi:hypothetical protein